MQPMCIDYGEFLSKQLQNKVLQHEIPQLHNEKLELTNQLKVIKQITEPF
jgi:hypothetical protein